MSYHKITRFSSRKPSLHLRIYGFGITGFRIFRLSEPLCTQPYARNITTGETPVLIKRRDFINASGKVSVKYSKYISVNLYGQLKALKTYLKSEIQKIHSIKELIELLLIKFNTLASNFPGVITACFLFLTLAVTSAFRNCW